MSSDTRQTDEVYDATSKPQTFVRHSAWCICTGNALYTMAEEQLGPYNTQCYATGLDSDETHAYITCRP